MPRFYINVDGPEGSFRDTEGEACAQPEQAISVAIQSVKVALDLARASVGLMVFSSNVQDEAGRTVFRVVLTLECERLVQSA